MRSIEQCRILLLAFCCGGSFAPANALAQENPKNPIQNFFKQLDKGIKGGAEEIEQAKLGRDQLDIRPPQRSEDQRRLRQALTLIQNERWHDAVEILQYLIDQKSDAFLISPEREFLSIHGEVERILRELPEDGKRNYLNRFSPVAEDLLKSARRDRDEAALLEVSQRYLNTPAGQAALQDLIQSWIDRGELVSSAEGALRLMQTTNNTAMQQQLMSQATSLLARAGQSARAKQAVAMFASQKPSFNSQELLDLIEATPVVTGERLKSVTPYSPSETVTPVSPEYLPQWSARIVERYSVQEQIETLISDIGEQGNGRALIPTSQPIIVAGNLVYRSLRGLVVRDPLTGKVLWENRPKDSPEEQLTPVTWHDSGEQQSGPKIEPYSSNMVEQHTLASLLYRDGIYGCLTSIGTSLYSIENTALIDSQTFGYSWRRSENNVDKAEQARLSTNELVAYDLSDVSHIKPPRWILGGPKIEDQFSRRLAGTYFFGPPVADGDDLFVIGEQAEEIFLYCLSARTGDLLWSQSLAFPGRPIDQDMVRRYWNCLPLIHDGMVICPTNCGWLVAVDRHTHDLRWASRYSPRKKRPQRFRGGFDIQNLQSLNVRWTASMPIAEQGRILFTPPEFPDEFGMKAMLICLDQLTGQELWSLPKGDGLYLAGVHAGHAIVVGSHDVQARSIDGKGDVVWTCPLPSEKGEPSGRCVINGDQLILPLSERTLLTIDLETGKIEETKTLLDSVPALGNLLIHNEALISLSPLNLMSFQSADSVRQLAGPQLSPLKDCMNEAERLRSTDQITEALKTLEQFQQQPEFAALSKKDQRQLTNMEWNILTQAAFKNPADSASESARIEQLANTPERIAELNRLRAEQHRQKGDWKQATILYLSLLDSDQERWISEGNKFVRHDRWVGGRMADMFATLNKEQQTEFNSTVRLMFNAKHSELARDVLFFTEVGQEFELRDAMAAEKAGRSGEAILLYQRAAESNSVRLRGQAWAELGELFLKLKMYEDANLAFTELQKMGEMILPGGRDPAGDRHSSEVTKSGLQACAEALSDRTARQVVWDGNWQVAQHISGASRYSTATTRNRLIIETSGTPLEIMKSKSFQLEYQSRRLTIEDDFNGELYWNFPLMTFPPARQHQSVGVVMVGPLGFALHQGVLHAMNLPDRQILWTYSPQISGVAASRLRFASTPIETRMRTPASIVAAHRPETRRSPTGYLLAATSRCLLLMDRDLIALDPLTGQVLWREQDVSNRTVAHVLHGNLLVMGNGTEHALLRPTDGAVIKTDPLGKHSQECIVLQEDRLVILTQVTDTPNNDSKDTNPPPPQKQNLKDYVVRNVSLDGEQEFWSHAIPGASLMSLEDSLLLWIAPSGEFVSLDLLSGERKIIGTVPEELAKIKTLYYLVSDPERYYVVAAHGEGRTPHVSLNPSIRARGTILTFARTGGLLWSRPTTELGPQPEEEPQDAELTPEEKEKAAAKRAWTLVLVARELDRSPLLVFVSDQAQQRDGLYVRQLQLVCLDKQTGETKLMWERPSDSGGFSQFHVDLSRGYISLQTYNQQLQIQPVLDQQANAGETK